MSYSIQQVSQMTNIPATTLRYYDKEGLLPFLKHNDAGYREFTEADLSGLQIVQCLKATGMSIAEIKQFFVWVAQGDASLEQRYQMFVNRRAAVEKQIEELKKSLEVIAFKCRYYETAIARGTEKNMPGFDKLPYADDFVNAG